MSTNKSYFGNLHIQKKSKKMEVISEKNKLFTYSWVKWRVSAFVNNGEDILLFPNLVTALNSRSRNPCGGRCRNRPTLGSYLECPGQFNVIRVWIVVIYFYEWVYCSKYSFGECVKCWPRLGNFFSFFFFHSINLVAKANWWISKTE